LQFYFVHNIVSCSCFSVFCSTPFYEAKKESAIKDFVETSTNPFDKGKSITGLDNKKKKTPFEKQRQKLKERIEQEKDQGIKRELRKGNIVQIIEDAFDY
jgi:hypothetical protein